MNVYILPSKNKNNKYIDLFIGSLRDLGKSITVKDIKNDTLFQVFKSVISNYNPKVKNIIHIHWSTIIYGSRFAIKSILLMSFNIALILILKFLYNAKIVWTVHNYYAHDYTHRSIDNIGRYLLFKLSNAVVTQEETSYKEYLQKYGTTKIKYIPHGNYIDCYGPIVERKNDLRRSLGFDENDIVLLSIGAIAKYKRNESIIESVKIARKYLPNLKLLIVGKGKEEYINSLYKLIGDDHGIVIKNNFVQDIEMPNYLSICDYSIFFYDSSEMTSGAIILSLSYGVPVISRNIPGAERVRGNSGFVFDNTGMLNDILKNKIKKFDNSTRNDIIDTVRNDSWKSVSMALYKLYNSL